MICTKQYSHGVSAFNHADPNIVCVTPILSQQGPLLANSTVATSTSKQCKHEIAFYRYKAYPYNENYALYRNTKDDYVKRNDGNRVVELPLSPVAVLHPALNAPKFFKLFVDPHPPLKFRDEESGYVLALQNRDPNLYVIEGCFTADEFQRLALKADELFQQKRGSLVDNSDSESVVSNKRTSISMLLNNTDFEGFIGRLAKLTGIPANFFENLQLVGYTTGDMKYEMHHDSVNYEPGNSKQPKGVKQEDRDHHLEAWLSPTLCYEEDQIIKIPASSAAKDVSSKTAANNERHDTSGEKRRRHPSRCEYVEYVGGGWEPFRILTFLVYLNSLTPSQNGCTNFPWAVDDPETPRSPSTVTLSRPKGVNIKPVANSGVLWSNVATNENGDVVVDPRVIHAAQKLKGEPPAVMSVIDVIL